ncbi:transcriptional regulator [Pantoea ananatis]|uniref:transcriptional regulator n=1 Tax=Pantoea ananas TaxID=553 RepID=UPI0021F7CABE|nr:transcriptional regulator [Pantoea ananatis]MCW0346723.1 hypothetical protein [Pantoea ananatis]
MSDITSEITSVLSDHSRFNAKQLNIIIAFVNELDNDTLHQFENGSERSIMSSYEQLLAASKRSGRRQYDEEYELESLTGSDRPNITMRSNSAFFNRFKTSPANLMGYGGNIYRDQTKSYYDMAGKILTTVGGAATFGAGTAVIAATQVGSSLTSLAVRYALSSVGATGLAGGAMVAMRNNFSDIQVATNKDFLETVKSVAKLRNKLNDFFRGLYNKVLKDTGKAETALNDEMGSHPLRYSAGSENQLVRTNLTPIQSLITQDFANPNYDINAKILPQGTDSEWRIAVVSMRGGERILNRTNVDVLQQVVNRL